MIILVVVLSLLLFAGLVAALLKWHCCARELRCWQTEKGGASATFAALPGIGLILKMADGQIADCNLGAAEFLNLPQESVRGQCLSALFPQEMATALSELVAAALNSSTRSQADIDHSPVDGQPQHWQFVAGRLGEAGENQLIYCWGRELRAVVEQGQKWRQASQMYLEIIENLPCVLFVKDYTHGNRYLLSSKLFHQQLNLPQGEMAGKSDFDFFSPAVAEKYVADDAVVMQSDDPYEIVEKFPTASAGVRAYHTRKIRLPRQGGDLLLGVSQDVTDLLQKNDLVQLANKSLHGYIRQQQMITSCLAYLMVDDDDDTSIQKVLRSFCEHLQASRFIIVICDSDNDEMLLAYEHCNNGQPLNLADIEVEKIPSADIWFQRLCEREILSYDSNSSENSFPSQELATLRWSQGLAIKSLYAAGIFFSGRLWGTMGVIYEEKNHLLSGQDRQLLRAAAHIMEIILQRKRNHLRLEQALLNAQKANEAKSSFLATMSHEIRTPLNTVIGFSELLQYGDLSEEEYQECVSSINVAGNALLGLINDILDLSKIEADQMLIVPQVTDVRELVEELQAVFWQAAKSKGLFLEIEGGEELPRLELDSLRLRQILLNLLGNAIKFTEYGGVKISIAFQNTTEKTGQLAIKVIDTGIGIKTEAKEKIFAPFMQQDAIRDSRVFKGTGLGLAISRRLADCMRGQLSVESTLGQGSTFTLIIPEAPISEQPKDQAIVSTEEAAETIFPVKVLLVDDVPMNLKVLLAMLRKFSVAVETAESAPEALQKMTGRAVPEMVFTDIWMPGMNGYELLQQIRSRAEFQAVKVVAVTADTSAQGDSKMAGFDAILLKPVTLAKVRSILLQLAAGKS